MINKLRLEKSQKNPGIFSRKTNKIDKNEELTTKPRRETIKEGSRNPK